MLAIADDPRIREQMPTAAQVQEVVSRARDKGLSPDESSLADEILGLS
jgi:hypothetical protein